VPVNPADYATELRTEIERYLRRAAAYATKRVPPPPINEMGMVYQAQVRYETLLAGHSDAADRAALAQAYVTKLRPCYEWEGFHDCPERDAQFADSYLAANPKSPFADFLPLLAAHRWLCASEGYEYEKQPAGVKRTRELYEKRLSVARQSRGLLLRTAADRLASRGQCLPVK